MAKRFKLSSKKSRKIFRKGTKFKSKNVRATPMRGGIRA